MFGFPNKFVVWIMGCITALSYSLTINSGLKKSFLGKRGIKQGDQCPHTCLL